MNGQLYVCCLGRGRGRVGYVGVFDLRSERLLRTFGKGEMDSAYACVVSPENEAFVSDPIANAVKVFDDHGKLLRQWGPIEEWQRPRNPDGRFCPTNSSLRGQLSSPTGVVFDVAGN